MIIDFHQGIITYPSSGSIQQFLSYQSGYVTLSADNGRTDIAFSYGVEDYLHTEASTIPQAWGPITTGVDAWLYWDIDTRSAVRTFGVTYIQPSFGSLQPTSPVNDQHWFDTTTKQMKVYNSAVSRWVIFIRVFACKINGSVFSPLGSNIAMPYAGTQVGLTSPSVATGRILVDVEGKPIRRTNGSFFTTEDEFFVNGSPVNALRLESLVQDVTANEPIAAHQVVKYSDFGEVLLATYNDTQSTAIAMSLENITTNETGIVAIQGIITNPNWAWTEVGIPLWIHGTIPGYLTDVDPHIVSVIDFPEKKPPVARVITHNTVYFDQGLGGYGSTGGTVSGDFVEIAGDVMTGLLTLSGNPTTGLHAATKQYVDSRNLNSLSDVTITGPSTNQYLKYNGSQWINAAVTVPSDLNSLTDVVISTPTLSEVLSYDGTQWINAPLDMPTAVGLRQVFTATADQVIFTGMVHPYVVGGGQLTVYINGIQQYPASIVELTTTSFSIPGGVNLGDMIMAEVSTITPPYIQPPTVAATGYKQMFVATPGQTTFGPLANSYVVGGGLLSVFINGVLQYPNAVTELSTNSFSIADPSNGGDEVLAVISDITPPYIYPPQPSVSLDSLTDVTITAPATNNYLRFSGTEWVNTAFPTSPTTLDALTDVTLTTPTTGQMLSYNGTEWVNATPVSDSSLYDLAGDIAIALGNTVPLSVDPRNGRTQFGTYAQGISFINGLPTGQRWDITLVITLDDTISTGGWYGTFFIDGGVGQGSVVIPYPFEYTTSVASGRTVLFNAFTIDGGTTWYVYPLSGFKPAA